jgi:hypothetical protein
MRMRSYASHARGTRSVIANLDRMPQAIHYSRLTSSRECLHRTKVHANAFTERKCTRMPSPNESARACWLILVRVIDSVCEVGPQASNA